MLSGDRCVSMSDAAAAISPPSLPARFQVTWAKVVDQTRCIGCHACTIACKSEHDVPVGVTRTYVKYVDVGVFPLARRAFQVNRCNQCDLAPCVAACPTGAMYQRADGIVDLAKTACIGCKACIAACPYDAVFINPEDRVAEKCNVCAHRLDLGLEPACVVACPTQALLVGDLAHPASRVASLVRRDAVTVRRPEKGTRPKLFYRGAHEAALDPLGARRPEGRIFVWSEHRDATPQDVVAGVPTAFGSDAGALLSYDVPHRIPWGWRVSLYAWTKGLAAGVWLVPAVLLLRGLVPSLHPMWRWLVPLLSGLALAATGALLLWDLARPRRFHLILTKPQSTSWLARGALVVAAFGAVLLAHLGGSLLGASRWLATLAWVGLPVAAATAVYTAWLLAQARARDLWQSPILAVQLLVQAVLLGGSALALFCVVFDPGLLPVLLRVAGVASGAYALLALAEVTVPHPTAHGRLAVWEMTRGRYRWWFWLGTTGVAVGAASPWLGLGAVTALVGVAAHEHAYLQAGQAVPLA